MAMPLQPERLVSHLIGDPTYFTGKPCKYGHIAKRNTVDFSCRACRDVQMEKMRPHKREYARTKRMVDMLLDPEGTRERNRAWKAADRKKDPEKYRVRERRNGRIKRQRYPERKLAEVRKRQAAKLQRTPKWADLEAIKAFYHARPDGMEIDHIVPLRGKTVCGFHVIENLQYLTPEDNRAKRARFDDWGDA